MTAIEMLLRYWFRLEKNPLGQVKTAALMVMPSAIWYTPARETQLPCLAGCGFSHAGLRPSAGRMQKSPGQEEAEPDEGKPVRDSDSLGSLSNKHKLSPALPSLLLDHVQDSESSSPQLRRILLIKKRIQSNCTMERAWGRGLFRWVWHLGRTAHFKYQEWPQAPQTPSSTVPQFSVSGQWQTNILKSHITWPITSNLPLNRKKM